MCPLILLLGLLLFLFPAAAPSPALAQEPPCAEIQLTRPIHPALTMTERRLICGDPTHGEGVSEGWTKIPRSQALLSLRGFLQSRGYLNPVVAEGAGVLRVDPGEITRATSLRSEGAPPFFNVERRRRIVGEPLTPKLLDMLEEWTRHVLSRGGYPCASVKAAGDPKSGEIVVHVTPGAPLTVEEIRSVLLPPDLDSSILRRYDAFELGGRYDENLLAISSDRAISDGVVERSFFTPVCPGTSGTVREESVLGNPTIFSAGFNLDTEQIGILRGSVKRVRIGKHSSSATLEALASSKFQRITGYFDAYFSDLASPTSFHPLIEVLHENEIPFEVDSGRGLLGLSTRWDSSSTGYGLVAGPQYEAYYTPQGSGPAHAHALALDLELRAISHGYEFNRTNLVGGFRAFIEGRGSANGVASDFGALRLRARAEGIINLGDLQPPFLLISLRGGYGITILQDDAAGRAFVPANLLQYLGGAEDLRGFARKELPGSHIGGLSAIFAGIELRPDLISETLLPMVFLDVGALGGDNYGLASPLYWSPGVGIHWKSPVGPFRATLAHGEVSGDNPAPGGDVSHWQFILTLGEPL